MDTILQCGRTTSDGTACQAEVSRTIGRACPEHLTYSDRHQAYSDLLTCTNPDLGAGKQ